MRDLSVISVANALIDYDPATREEVGNLNNLSAAQVKVQADAALVDYDPVTGAEAVILNTKVDDIDAELDIVHEETHEVLHATAHKSDIFPGNTNLTCTFTAAAGANTWSAYIEIVDSAATSLSDSYALLPGHITEIDIEELSDENTIYMIEISAGATHEVLTNIRFAGGTKFQNPSAVQRLHMLEIASGETLYYRMKTASGVADTAIVNFRYHTH